MTNTFTLTKNQLKNGKFQYIVTDQNGNVISTRTSLNHYVACTANGGFYFGRLDLIGKSKHGSFLTHTEAELKTTPEQYNARKFKVGTFDDMIENAKKCLETLNSIAYLQQ